MWIRTLVPCVLVVALAACGGGTDPVEAEQGDALRRTVVQLEVASRGLLEMDLRAEPPMLQPGYDDEDRRTEVTDLGAAGELVERLLALPAAPGDCAVTVEPPFAAIVSTFPTPENAPFADLAVHEVGGPCTDLTDDDIGALVDLWNRAGGSIEFDPAG